MNDSRANLLSAPSTRGDAIQPQANRPDTLSDKLWREARLLQIGLTHVPAAAKDELKDHPWQTLLKSGLSFGISAGVACATKERNPLGWLGLATVTVPAILDFSKSLKPSFAAFLDASHANCNWQKDVDTMEHNFAPLIFDSALSAVSTVGGGLAGNRISAVHSYEPQLPAFTKNGQLPPGFYKPSWQEVVDRYGYNTVRRKHLVGVATLMQEMRKNETGDALFLGGSFNSAKEFPNDFDATWRVSGAELKQLSTKAPLLVDRKLQEAQLGGTLMATYPNSPGDGILGFLQTTRDRQRVGVIILDIDKMPSSAALLLQRGKYNMMNKMQAAFKSSQLFSHRSELKVQP